MPSQTRIEGAHQLQHREQLRAGKDERGNADAACDDMHESAQRRPECGGDSGLPAACQRPRRDVENAGAGDRGNDRGGEQE